MKGSWLLVCALTGSGCARPAQPATATNPCAAAGASAQQTGVATQGSQKEPLGAAQPGATSSRDALRVTALGYDPKLAAAMVSTAAGVVVGRNLGCEDETPLGTVTHTCGARSQAAIRPLLPGLRKMLDLALQHPDEPGVECAGVAPVRCTVAPHGECHPLYELYFVENELVAILERDDWQGPDEYRQAFDDRVAAAMRDAQCP